MSDRPDPPDDSDRHDPPDDRSPDDAAGEFVLGTLSPAEAEALTDRLPHDLNLAAQVHAWQDRLLPLTRRAAAAAPSPMLWRRIAQSVEAAAPFTAAAASATTASSPPASRVAAAAARRPAAKAPPWWQRLGLWQGLSAAAVTASLLMGVLLLQRLQAPAPTRYLALLQAPDTQQTGWVVELQAGASLRLVPVADAKPPPAGQVLQFWTKAQGAARPTSLGLVSAGRTVVMPVSQLPAVEVQQLFEITLEPAGGSPTGRPTGPILFVGRTVQL